MEELNWLMAPTGEHGTGNREAELHDVSPENEHAELRNEEPGNEEAKNGEPENIESP